MSKSKRLLSLVLALIMVFALFAGAASADNGDNGAETTSAITDNSPIGDFTDVTWANPYAEAIAVIEAAEITQGDGDRNTYNPAGTVTRATVAAFIARTGITAARANLLLPGETGFPDVGRDHWANRYIAWAVSQNVISGHVDRDGNRYYAPDDMLTGVQILKMLCGVLNVDKVAELEGDLWQTNTMHYAAQLGLLEGMAGIDLSEVI